MATQKTETLEFTIHINPKVMASFAVAIEEHKAICQDDECAMNSVDTGIEYLIYQSLLQKKLRQVQDELEKTIGKAINDLEQDL